MTKLEIESRRLQGDIDRLKAHLADIRRTGARMMSNVNALSAMWEGEAKNAFVEQFRTDSEILSAMEGTIESLIGHLEDARGQYDACENSVASIVQGIRV